MNRRQVFTAAVAAPLAIGQSQRSMGNRLLGTWRLISWEETNAANGEITNPCGKRAVGQLMYDASDHMSGQIMNPDRPTFDHAPSGNLAWVNRISGAQALEVLAGCTSYFGTYSIDEVKRTVTHHVRGNIRPGMAGTDNVRSVEFLGEDRILLKYLNGPNDNRLIWVRERS